MARPLRIEYCGAVYHLTARGNRRDDIYLDDNDRILFLETLGNVVVQFHWRCHAYCLMDNHYHLLIETPEANLARGMRQLNGVYTQRLNRRHGRVGHVFQGRYKAIVVERDSYLLELARYVVLNPVRARMTRAAGEWRWSSYRATAGEAKAPAWLATDWLLSQFGGRQAKATYRRFVAEGAAATASPLAEGLAAAVRGGVALGGEEFLAGLADEAGGASAETPARQRRLARPTLAALRRDGDGARLWMAIAHRQYGYTLAEIAVEAGLHYSYISRIIKATVARETGKTK